MGKAGRADPGSMPIDRRSRPVLVAGLGLLTIALAAPAAQATPTTAAGTRITASPDGTRITSAPPASRAAARP